MWCGRCLLQRQTDRLCLPSAVRYTFSLVTSCPLMCDLLELAVIWRERQKAPLRALHAVC